MKVMTQAKATTEQANSAIKGARDQASSAVKDARKQTSSTVRAARKEARRQLVRARIGAARARAGARTSTTGASKKAVGAAGAAGLAAGYFLTKRQADYRAGQVEGKIEAAKHATDGEKLAPNDQALAEPPAHPVSRQRESCGDPPRQ